MKIVEKNEKIRLNKEYRGEAKEELLKLPFEIIECVKNLLAKPGAWVRGMEATNRKKSYGYYSEVDPMAEDAKAFCLVGAVKKCYGVSNRRDFMGNPINKDHATHLPVKIIQSTIADYNDNTNKQGVMNLLDEVLNEKMK